MAAKASRADALRAYAAAGVSYDSH
jgi:hypothetical protein